MKKVEKKFKEIHKGDDVQQKGEKGNGYKEKRNRDQQGRNQGRGHQTLLVRNKSKQPQESKEKVYRQKKEAEISEVKKEEVKIVEEKVEIKKEEEVKVEIKQPVVEETKVVQEVIVETKKVPLIEIEIKSSDSSKQKTFKKKSPSL